MRVALLAAAMGLLISCVAPRAMTETGRVTPNQQLRGGVSYSFNAASATAGKLYDGFEASVDSLIAQDKPTYDETTQGLSEGLIAFAVDPVGSSADLWMRYGVMPRLDIGYRFASGTHVLDTRYQFLGSPTEPNKGWSGSVGLQMANQSFEFPSIAGLDRLQDILGFEATRTDLLLPVIVSHAFGTNEKYGAMSVGVLLGRVNLDYGFTPIDMIQEQTGNLVDTTPIAAVHNTKSFLTYGGFGSLKLGYERAYLLAGLGIYYQDYGTFDLLDGGTVSLRGFTIVPTLGAEARFR